MRNEFLVSAFEECYRAECLEFHFQRANPQFPTSGVRILCSWLLGVY